MYSSEALSAAVAGRGGGVAAVVVALRAVEVAVCGAVKVAVVAPSSSTDDVLSACRTDVVTFVVGDREVASGRGRGTTSDAATAVAVDGLSGPRSRWWRSSTSESSK
jgi:hypothetical protein